MAAASARAATGPLSDGTASVAVGLAMVRAFVSPDGLAGVLHDTETVRAAGGPEVNPLWGLATVVQGTARSMLGEHDRARELLVSGLATVPSPTYRAATLAHLALLDLESGDLEGAARNAATALQLTRQFNLDAVLPALSAFAVGALVAARQGRRDEADRAAAVTERLLARLGDLSPRTAVLGYALLVRAAMAVGDRARARSLMTEANRARRREPGAVYFNEMLDASTRELASGVNEPALGAAPLTPAELRVLAYLPTHFSLQEIAEQLIISRNTAKSHSVSIYRKLGVSSRSDAVDAARRLGLVDA
jgi:LuxR family maltose regulon positive regulatory protein